MSENSQSTGHLKTLILRLHVQFKEREWRVAEMHSDQAGAFVNDELEAFWRSQGTFTTITNGYSPEENGVVEHANGLLLPRIRAMLAATRLPKDMRGDALLHSVHTLNRWTTSALPDGKAPYEAPPVSVAYVGMPGVGLYQS
jgi:hypothetical protein